MIESKLGRILIERGALKEAQLAGKVREQGVKAVFTERINNSGFGDTSGNEPADITQ